MTQWFDHVWNVVGNACTRECCGEFLIKRDLSLLKRLPVGARVLVGPADFFGEHVPDTVIRDILLVMARNPNVQFRIPTRNAFRMEQWFGGWASNELQQWIADMDQEWPIPNVELGVLVRDQDSADSYVGALVAAPAMRRFVVVDRLKGEVDLECMTCPSGVYRREQVRSCGICTGSEQVCKDGNYNALQEGISEVIFASPVAGLGSPEEPLWRGNIMHQCRKNNVSVIRPRLPNP